MHVKLIRHTFPDDEEWIVVDTNTPLGTVYEVIGYDNSMSIVNFPTGKLRQVECYLLSGNGDVGFLPTCLFEAADETHDTDSRRTANRPRKRRRLLS